MLFFVYKFGIIIKKWSFFKISNLLFYYINTTLIQTY